MRSHCAPSSATVSCSASPPTLTNHQQQIPLSVLICKLSPQALIGWFSSGMRIWCWSDVISSLVFRRPLLLAGCSGLNLKRLLGASGFHPGWSLTLLSLIFSLLQPETLVLPWPWSEHVSWCIRHKSNAGTFTCIHHLVSHNLFFPLLPSSASHQCQTRTCSGASVCIRPFFQTVLCVSIGLRSCLCTSLLRSRIRRKREAWKQHVNVTVD